MKLKAGENPYFEKIFYGYLRPILQRCLCLAIAMVIASSLAGPAFAAGSGPIGGANDPSPAKSQSTPPAAAPEIIERSPPIDKAATFCGPRRYRTNEELCAVWKAADAAADSARWSWIASISTIVGTAAVIAALWLTYQSNSIARDTARRQLRAYLVFEGLKPNPHRGEGGGIQYSVILRNVGQTPAKRVVYRFNTNLFDEDAPDGFEFNDGDTDEPERVVLGAGGLYEVAGPLVNVTMREYLIQTCKVFLIWGSVEYDDIYSARWRTEFSIKVMATGTGEQAILGHKLGSRFNNIDAECRYWPPKS